MLLGRGHLVVLASFAALAAPAACSSGSSNGEPGVNAGGSDGTGQSGAGAGALPSAGAGGASNASGDAGSDAGGDSSSGGAASQSAGGAGSGGTADSDAGADAGGGAAACNAEVTQYELDFGAHVALCSEIVYATDPPSSGPHYPSWADFGVYDFPLPRGFWVHNLEHGAVVVTYNCPDDCADEVAEAATWLAQLSNDAACPAGPPRVLLVPDPTLGVRWAASSWGFTLRADCFDAAAFSDFYLAHAGQPAAPESFVCGTGTDLRAPDANTCGAN